MITALDALGKLDFLGRGQQVDLADVLQEELQRIGGEFRGARLVDLFRRLFERGEEISGRFGLDLVERRRLLFLDLEDGRRRLFIILPISHLKFLGAHWPPSHAPSSTAALFVRMRHAASGSGRTHRPFGSFLSRISPICN